MRGSRDVSLTIFIIFYERQLTSFSYRFFHFSRPPGLRLTFDAAERNGNFGRIQCQRDNDSSTRRNREVFLCRRTLRVEVKCKVQCQRDNDGSIRRNREVFLCRKTLRVEVKCKVISTSFLKIEGRVLYVGAEERRKRQLVELEVLSTPAIYNGGTYFSSNFH